VPFQISLAGLLLLNYRIFHYKIDIRKWKKLFLLNVVLIGIAVAINYFLNSYAANHSYTGYAKVTISQSLKTSLETFIKSPVFVIKFFLIANTGNLIDNESFLRAPFLKNFIPLLGFLVVLLYGYCIYLFIKRRRLEYLYSVNLILFVLIFYFLVTLSRLYFNDLYYGSASRYTAATFSGMLAVATVFLLLFQEEKLASRRRKIFLASPIILICLCYLASNRNQWRIAPYRKNNFEYLIQNLKAGKNFETMQGGGRGIVQVARSVMIKHQLSVFRPQYNLNNFVINSDLKNIMAEGFYGAESSGTGRWRWTNGQADIFLPNLYSDKDSIRVKLFCYTPVADTPRIILNDNLAPLSCSKFNGGFQYSFRVYGPSVFYRARILSKNFVPHLSDSTKGDVRTLGLVFNSIRFEELVDR